LFIPSLTERAKSLLACLSKERLDSCGEVKKYLFHEFKLSQEQCRDRFKMAEKLPNETFTLYGSRLRKLVLYYLDSRKVETN